MISELINELTKQCSCGQKHFISLKKIIIEKGAVHKIKDVTKGYEKITAIYDTNTFKAIDNKIAKQIKTKSIILNSTDLHADEKSTSYVLEKIDKDTKLLIAAGSGTIHDITRYVAKEMNIDFISFPTAPSVDGFVSSVAAMTWHGFKRTFPSVAPIAIVADLNIIKKAPSNLIASGVGDLIGKYIALGDWRIANILVGEHFCKEIHDIMLSSVNNVVKNLDAIKKCEDDGIYELVESLVLSGVAMQMIGNSRPASGAEHHLSHFWEMMIINPYISALHGEKVGVASVYISEIYHDFFKQNIHLSEYSVDEELIRKYFKGLADEIIDDNKNDLLLNISFDRLLKNEEKIKEVIECIPTKEKIMEYLKTVYGSVSLGDIGLNDDILLNSLKLAPYIRVRPTFLRLIKSSIK